MSENLKVLAYLKTGKSLTVERAKNLKLTNNLRSRISNLIDMDHDIQRQFIPALSLEGRPTRVMEYWL